MVADIRKEDRDPGIRRLAGLAASMVLWLCTFIGAHKILASNTEALAPRAAAVLLAVAGFLPWIWLVSRAIAAEDEFTRKIHFVAIGWAFAATGVFLVCADFLVRAHFIDYVPIMYIWLFMIVVWWISIMLTARYYR